MDTSAKFATLNNVLSALEELDIKGSSSDRLTSIKQAVRAVMQALATEANAAAATGTGNGSALTADAVLNQTTDTSEVAEAAEAS